jgi:hypothetical protein
MQDITPNRDNPNVNVPNPGSAVPAGVNFSPDEWRTLATTPLKIGRAMIAVSPSGPVGVVQESMAMKKGVEDLMNQSSTNPLLNALGKQLKTAMETAQASGQYPLGDMLKAPQDGPQIRQDALTTCRQAISIVDRNATPQDATAYKQYLFSLARKVAEAGREGGFLGIFGGEQISSSEQALLKDLANTLGIQPS